ncbi:MAG: SDR family NAD(P)-dependent oxidoreductase [Burkholderiales bacterium]
MTQHLFILTGASRGMGAAIAEQLLLPGNRVLCLSRQVNEPLSARARAAGIVCDQWPVDLGQPIDAAARVQAWLATLDARTFASATLINNAAALTRIGPVDTCTDVELSASLRVGLEAPMLLCAAFLRGTRSWAAKKRVLNISSGLGRRAMAAQAPYSAAKAGLDHYTRVLALDEALQANGARVASLAPGVIDTDMQVHLRAADAAVFPDKSNFVGLKDNGQLTSTTDAAARVLAYLNRPDFGTNPVADVRDA